MHETHITIISGRSVWKVRIVQVFTDMISSMIRINENITLFALIFNLQIMVGMLFLKVSHQV